METDRRAPDRTVRLTRLRIDRFRNVAPGTDIHFGPAFNVLLGKNATGKTTLLDLVAAVSNDNLSAYSREAAGFDLTWWLERGENQLELHAQRTPANSSAIQDPSLEPPFDDAWSIVVRAAGAEIGRIEVEGTRGTWRPRDGAEERFDLRAGLAFPSHGARAMYALLDKHPDAGRPSPISSAARMLRGFGRIGRLDEALGALNAIMGVQFETSQESNGAFSSAQFGPWVPSDFMSLAQDPALATPFEKVHSLREVPGLLGFESAALRPRVVRRSQEGTTTTTTFQGLDCLFRRADGSEVSLALLSFGQKRLFSFLWYLAVREDGPVVADELLNGLHYDWIEACIERLRGRQSFLATQHPMLLDHIPIGSAADARTTFVRCALEAGSDGHERLVWRNLDDQEGERFFIAYQTGIQHVSEVLRSEGLW